MRLELRILDAADRRDRKTWIDLWEQWPGREIFGHPDYVRLYAVPRVQALCATASADGSYVLYPFLLRTLGDEQYCDVSLRDCTDISTPYGYGGPFRWGAAWNPEAGRAFWLEFDAWAAKSRVVSEVVRLSLFPEILVEYIGDRRVLLDNVVRALNSEDELWRDFEHKVRKNVNKARAGGVTVRIDEKGDRLDDFLAIYASTMNRRNARESYYFPREYFERIHADLKGQFAYFHAFVGGAIVSTELVLVSADRIYSFLGGTDAAWFHVRPNDLLKVEIMNWARSAGKKEFVLGGGYASGDGIYRYKLSFAPNGSVPFSIGSRVLNINAYEQMIHARRTFAAMQGVRWQPNPDYFPAYRA
jgi:Acetyltransferase (GNAT) domain